jgi:hypothetical protein
MSTLSQFAAGGVKSVQRGVIQLATNVSTNTATISSVNTNKSFISFLGQSTSSLANYDAYPTHLELTSSTEITATRNFTNGAVTVSYEVIEFY